MELRHLRYFVAVANERHFGRAAKALHMAQPPLSRQIRALEEEVGLRLFDRSKHKVELTAAGASLLEHSRSVFDAVDLALREARRADRGESGRLALGYVSSVAYAGLPELLRAFRARFPGVDMTLREAPPSAQIEALKNRHLDIGFLRGPVDDDALVTRCVRKEALRAVVPSDHPLAKKSKITLAMLAREPFVFFQRQRGAAFYDLVIAMCRGAGFSPRVVAEAPHLDIVSLVAAGFGVSVLTASLENLRREGAVFIPIVGSPTTDLLVAWRRDDASPIVRELVSLIETRGMKVHARPSRG